MEGDIDRLDGCDFCASENKVAYMKTDLVSYSKCAKCGLIFQDPMLSSDDIKLIYGDSYFEYEAENQDSFFNLMLLALRDIGFDNLKNKLPSKKVLDIGCATGKLLNYLKSDGFETYGVEICKESAEYARKNYGLNIYERELIANNFADDSFGIIHFSHVIEHVPNPNDFLKEVYRILMKGGYAIITTPNASGLFSKYYFDKWRAVMPQHLWLFSKDVFVNKLKEIGFSVLETHSWGSIPLEKSFSKSLKKITDKFVKRFDMGDVMLILCRK